MRIIQLLFLLAYVIPIIFNSSTDGYTIKVASGTGLIDCFVDDTDNKVKLEFSFKAITSGFNEKLGFKVKLDYPDYAFTECFVPPSTGKKDIIRCYINIANFPLVENKTSYQLPSQLNDINDTKSLISIEGWDTHIGLNPIIEINEKCNVPYTYTFVKNQEEPFKVQIDEKTWYRYLFGKGSFDGDLTLAKQNYLSETDPPVCVLTTYIYVDTDFNYYPCDIYISDETINSGDYEIHCTVSGEKKAVFFPTLSYSPTNQQYIKLDIYEEVSLSKSSSGTLAKISGLLLLSLLLF